MKLTKELFKKSLSSKTILGVNNKKKTKIFVSALKINGSSIGYSLLIVKNEKEELNCFFNHIKKSLGDKTEITPMFFNHNTLEIIENKEYEKM